MSDFDLYNLMKYLFIPLLVLCIPGGPTLQCDVNVYLMQCLNKFDFHLYILKKYIFIPLLVLCIPILWGPALQCGYVMFEHRRCFGVRRSSVGRQGVGLQL